MKYKYILMLYKQYCDSIGKPYDKYNIMTDTDFVIYLSLLKKQIPNYERYLKYLGLSLNSDNTIELNKGKYDTLGKDAVTLVSPFAETVGCENSKLIVYKNVPFIIMGITVYTANNCDLFLTHNPFDEESVGNLIELHNNGANVCIGVYGKNSDKNKEAKIKMLISCEEEMYYDSEFHYDTEGDNYYSCIKSEPKIKKLILSR